jgi:hypothetical protein
MVEGGGWMVEGRKDPRRVQQDLDSRIKFHTSKGGHVMDKDKLKKILDFIHLRFRAHGTELGMSAEEVIQEARQVRTASESEPEKGADDEPDREPQ